MSYCTAEPANFAGIAAVSVGSITQTPGVGNGHYSVANGDVSGRTITTAARTGINFTASGVVSHVALDDGINLLVVVTCTTKAVTVGGLGDSSAFKYEIGAPA